MRKRCVICVDDELLIVESLVRELRKNIGDVEVFGLSDGPQAIKKINDLEAQGQAVAVLITDERLPLMSGHSLLRHVYQTFPAVKGILVTAYADTTVLAESINQANLFRYIAKPWKSLDMILAVRRALDLYDNEQELEAQRAEIQRLNLAMIAVLEDSGHRIEPDFKHAQRVGCYSALLAFCMGLDISFIRKMYLYAPLHDIGKSGIPHEILTKAAPLSLAEYSLVKTHVSIGVQLLKSIEVDPIARDLILYHHERWDGKGYLTEQAGDRIPLSARIVALADSLDAMMSRRPYKESLPFEAAAQEIRDNADIRFDPKIVDVFLRHQGEFEAISTSANPEKCIERVFTKPPVPLEGPIEAIP